jgi:hypothetical protein
MLSCYAIFLEDMTLNNRKMKTNLTHKFIYITAMRLTAKRRKKHSSDPEAQQWKSNTSSKNGLL